MIGCGGILSMPEYAGVDRSQTPFSRRLSEEGPCRSRRHQAAELGHSPNLWAQCRPTAHSPEPVL